VRILNNLAIFTLLMSGLLVQCGCTISSPEPVASIKALSRPLTGVNSVVFMGLTERNSYPGIARDMTMAISHALQARGLFGLDVVDRQDPLCPEISMVGRGGLTLDQLKEMRETFKCDGVLLGSINDFRPHPRMQLGVSLRMLDLKRGRLLWAVDHVWDTADKAVEQRIKRYFEKQIRSGADPMMDWRIAMISPVAFEKFIAYELAQTLPDPIHAAISPKLNTKSTQIHATNVKK
jgi:hypothetical protein